MQKKSVVITGYIGLEGTAILAKANREKIDAVYPAFLVRNALSAEKVDEESIKLAKRIISEHFLEYSDGMVTEVSKGGILTALWNMAKELGEGFELDLRKIPIRQETIEICELLEVNPYHLYSNGCMIVCTSEGELLAERFARAGINASVIGMTNDTKAHILNNDGTISHLNRPEPDELERLGLLSK